MNETTNTLPEDRNVLVYFGENNATRQPPQPIRCCARGVELYSETEIEPFKVYKVQMRLPVDNNQTADIQCDGVVVDCQPESSLYKLQVSFLDLPDSAKAHLDRMSDTPVPSMAALIDFLRLAVDNGASDIHLKLDQPPIFRVSGKLIETDTAALTEPVLHAIADEMVPDRLKERFFKENEVDFALHEEDIGRFRVNVYMSRGVPTFALRHVKTDVPSITDLHLPEVITKIALAPRGIILATGATGSGKSSTLAAIIRHINENKHVRIITIEDPIEYLFLDKKSLISQREVELDTLGFRPALKHVLRQDPDVIMVGEMRDQESFMAALSAAETGHLVLSTLHSDNASGSISRILDFFPAHERDQARMAIAANLRAVLSQRLVPAKEGGIRPAVEIMINTPVVKKLMEKNNLDKLSAAIDAGGEDGMQSFDQCVYMMIKEGLIREYDGLHFASNPEAVKMKMQGIFIEGDKSILQP